MTVLVACEFSGVVRDAFRDKGADAYSVDLLPSSGKYPEFHFQGDVLEIDWQDTIGPIDLLIGFPPCTHLASSGARWWKEKGDEKMYEAIFLFLELYHFNTPRCCIENPVGRVSTLFRPPDQIIHPWQFGHPQSKTTCLWTRGLPPLKPTEIVPGRSENIHESPDSKDRWEKRSITFPGIAKAMADQWGSTRPMRESESG